MPASAAGAMDTAPTMNPVMIADRIANFFIIQNLESPI